MFLTLFPENPSALFARAETFLAMGELEAGFRDYQARLRVDKWKSKYPVLPGITEYDGASLDGKTILVRGEQGFGDTIQFARYLPQVKEKGGYVIFEIKEPVFSLFEDYPGVDPVAPQVHLSKPCGRRLLHPSLEPALSF